MRTILHSLAWKEWHEHKWKFASILAVLWATAALALLYGENDGFGLAVVIVSFCVVPFAVFVGLGAAASERSRGTLAFLQALPTPMWPIALAKLIFGLLTLTASVVLTLPLFYGWAHWFDRSGAAGVSSAGNVTVSGNIYLDIALLCVTLAASLYIWSAAAGVNRKDEVSAGAVALVVIIGWYVMLIILAYLLFGWRAPNRGSIAESIIVFGLSTAPAGFLPATGPLWDRPKDLSDVVWYRYLLLVLITATTMHVALAAWYVRRFGRTANLEVRSPQVAVRQSSSPDWLSPPRQSAIAAIAWKQFRESGPLVLAGLAGVVGISLGIFGSDPSWFSSRPGQFVEMATIVGAYIGFVITLIVGVGVCFYDVSPQQNTFWRSRPINPDTWFWSKFVTGLVILVIALYVPLLIVVFGLHSDPSHFLAANSGSAIITGQIAVFAAAVAMTSLVRQAIYAAILSIPLTYFGVVVVWIALKAAGVVGWVTDPPNRLIDMSESQVTTGFLLTFFFSTVLGWLSVRYDWGRKSRY